MALSSFQVFFSSRISTTIFLLGKIVRFFFFLGFLVYLTSKTNVLSGYTVWHVVLFYLTFSFLDSSVQMLFQEVYRFRKYILDGSFDMLLLKPINTLFRSLFGATDLLDFITLVPFLIGIGFTISHIQGITGIHVILYVTLLINSILIAASFHIAVLSLGIVSTEIDNAIMLYRDISGMGKIPVDIYKEPIRSFITFVIPVGIMMTIPAKTLLGLTSFPIIAASFLVSILFLFISISLWNRALSHYTSASS